MASSAARANEYNSSSITVLEGLEASASAPACTSARRPSAACTTWSGRSSTTPSTRRWPATATASRSPCWPTAASGSSTTAAACRSTSTRELGKTGVEVVLTVAARRRQVRQRLLRGLRRPARRRRLGRQRAVQPARGRDQARRLRLDAALRRPEAGRAARARREDQRDRHHRHVLGRRHDLRDDHVLLRDDQPPAAGDGLPEQGPDHRAARRAGRQVVEEDDQAAVSTKAPKAAERGHLPLRRRHRRLRPAPQRHQGRRSTSR